MQILLAKVMPRLLNYVQKNFIMHVCKTIIARVQVEEDTVWNVITGSYAHIFEYDQVLKHRSCQWKYPMLPTPKKSRQSKSKVRNMLLPRFSVTGRYCSEFLSQAPTINLQVYKNMLRRWHSLVR